MSENILKEIRHELKQRIENEYKQKYSQEKVFYVPRPKKKYELTKDDLKKIPHSYYKQILMIKKMFDPKRHQKKLDECIGKP